MKCALVIELQNEYVSGNLKISFPDPMTSIPDIEVAWDAEDDHGVPVFARVGGGGAALLDRGPHLGAHRHERQRLGVPFPLIWSDSCARTTSTPSRSWAT